MSASQRLSGAKTSAEDVGGAGSITALGADGLCTESQRWDCKSIKSKDQLLTPPGNRRGRKATITRTETASLRYGKTVTRHASRAMMRLCWILRYAMAMHRACCSELMNDGGVYHRVDCTWNKIEWPWCGSLEQPQIAAK